MSALLLVIGTILATCFCASASSFSDVYEIEHRVGDDKFVGRGAFTVTTDSEGVQVVTDADKAVIGDAGSIDAFKKALQTDDLYQLRIYRKGHKNSGEEFVYSSIPACALQKSGFKEDISLFFGDGGELIGTSYQSPTIGMPRPCDPSKLRTPINFLTRIKIGGIQESMTISVQATGPKPPMLAHVNLGSFVDESGNVKQEAPRAETQSFLRKYWYIALALVIYMMLGQEAEKPSDKKKKE